MKKLALHWQIIIGMILGVLFGLLFLNFEWGKTFVLNWIKPFGTILLDEPVVIWRTSDSTPYAMRDLCIHRGTALSLGWVENDCLVCPYHAWQYNKEGACVLIPQAKEIEIPSHLKAIAEEKRIELIEAVAEFDESAEIADAAKSNHPYLLQ